MEDKGVLEVQKKVLTLLILNTEDEVGILLTTDFNVYVDVFINCNTVVWWEITGFSSSCDFSEEVGNDWELDAFLKAKRCHIICSV